MENNVDNSQPQIPDAPNANRDAGGVLSDAKAKDQHTNLFGNLPNASATRTGYSDANRDASQDQDTNSKTETLPDAPDANRDAEDDIAPGDPFKDLSNYTLTIGEAIDRFTLEGRAEPALRTAQGYCKDGNIDCFKIQTSRDGRPVSEWLVNEASLMRFIETRPKNSDAMSISRDAEQRREPENIKETHPDAETQTPAAEDQPKTETRTLAEVLIENAKLSATVGGKDEIIGVMKENTQFIRDELTDARKMRQDVKDITSRMLEMFEAMSLGGKLERPTPTEKPAPIPAQIVQSDQTNDHPETQGDKEFDESRVGRSDQKTPLSDGV